LLISRDSSRSGSGQGLVLRGWRWLVIGSAAVLGFVNVASLWVNLHRYTVGLHSSTWNLAEGVWQPRLGAWTWVAIVGVWATAVVAFVAQWSRVDPVGGASAATGSSVNGPQVRSSSTT